MRFVDTNVLLYAVSTAEEERDKRQVALEVLDETELVLSVQVLQEFYVQATRPTRSDRLSHDQAMALVDSWLRYPIQEMSISLMQNAFSTAARWAISYWDAAVIEAARARACHTLLSEDLQNGMDFAGVRVVNPFAPH